MSKLIYKLMLSSGAKKMKNLYFQEGFFSKVDSECPYVFPLEVNLKQIKISSVRRALTEEEKEELRSLREVMDATPWSQWTHGNYIRGKCFPDEASMAKVLKRLLMFHQGDNFSALKSFYRLKHAKGFLGLFSCHAAENFPIGWLGAIKNGTWEEKGIYGDNFREVFGLK